MKNLEKIKSEKMSSTGRKAKSVRPLGAVRQPIQTPLERVGRIPAFNYNKAVHHDYELQGNAMQVNILLLHYKFTSTEDVIKVMLVNSECKCTSSSNVTSMI